MEMNVGLIIIVALVTFIIFYFPWLCFYLKRRNK